MGPWLKTLTTEKPSLVIAGACSLSERDIQREIQTDRQTDRRAHTHISSSGFLTEPGTHGLG